MTALENVNLPIEISGNFKNNKMAMELLTAVGLKTEFSLSSSTIWWRTAKGCYSKIVNIKS